MTLPNGTSKRVHADWLMTEIEQATAQSFAKMRHGSIRALADREAIRRQLAGVIGRLEDLRLWVERGAPQ